MSEEEQPATQEGNVVNNSAVGAVDAGETNAVVGAVAAGGTNSANTSSSNDPPNNSSSTDPVNFAAVYIDENKFFAGLQDDGKQLTADEIAKNTKKRGCIMHGQMFYKSTFEFSKELYNHYKTQPDILPKLGKNDSKVMHTIGKKILEMKQTTTRADIHTVVTDGNQLELSKSDEYTGKTTLSFLPQKTWVEWVISRWATNESDEKKTEVDDMLRAVGIMFQEDMREFIQYLLSVNDPGSNSNERRGRRQVLDEWTAKRNLAKRNLHTRFIDIDCVVEFNVEWKSEDARERIDKRLGDGFYDSLNINPNNPERIKIAFTEKEVLNHFSEGVRAYNQMMVNYQMNTGGGNGDPLLVVAWEEREPLDIVGYATNKEEDVYLTNIHLWDKAYEFPLTVVKGKGVPEGVGVDDDDIDYGNSQGDEWDISTVATNGSNVATPATAKSKSNVGLQSILRQQSRTQQAEREKMVTKMVAAIKDGLKEGGGEGESKVDMQTKLQGAIKMSKEQLKQSVGVFTKLKRKRKTLKEMVHDSPSNEKLKKKLFATEAAAKRAGTEVQAFQATLDSQVDQLNKLSAAENGNKADDIDLSDVESEVGSEDE